MSRRPDPHSYADLEQPRARWFDWRARVDFPTRRIHGEVELHFERPTREAGPLDLDTRDLTIHAVSGADRRQSYPFEIGAPDPVLGSRLRITLPAGAASVRVSYTTSPEATALQWLTPSQTFGGRDPFLFTQGQAIHTRSIVPLQDTPSIRVRYRAEVTGPSHLVTVMAASSLERVVRGNDSVSKFEMNQPIPPYLFAFALGDLQYRDVGPRSRVWAEPAVLEKAAWEFAGVDRMLVAAEKLFGRYDWERFDILTMPMAFPYGGMENPRLTFLTPTLLAGDRSLVNVVAHELAHSWTGNLVTNASAEDFWLNEGFTVFAERRILEALEGPELTALHAAIGRKSLDVALENFKETPQFTRLKTRLTGVDPDAAFSVVPYEKGYLFLRALEDAVGRDRFSAFLLDYVRTFAFGVLTTEEFLAFARSRIPEAFQKVNVDAWVHGEGVPAEAPKPRSQRLAELEGLSADSLPPSNLVKTWTPTEWQLYLDSRPRPSPPSLLEELDQAFSLTTSRNYEVLVAWLTLALRSGHRAVLPRVGEVLGEVGRMKYLKPLYQALAADSQTKAQARAWFEQHANGYHPIARQGVEGILKRAGA